MNLFHKIVNKNIKNTKLVRSYVSALYITGDQAKTSYAVLTPYMHFQSTLHDENLVENIKRRNLKIDYNAVMDKYRYFKEVQDKKVQMEERRQAIANELKRLDKEANTSNSDLKSSLKEEGKSIREDLKALKENFYSFEDEFIHTFLSLPNKLHAKCPVNDEPSLLYRKGVFDSKLVSKSHLERKDLLDFKDNFTYYLFKEAAEFDLQFTYNAVDYFTQSGYTQMANPDFSRGIVTEANTTEDFYFAVDEHDGEVRINGLNLTGGGSFESFLPYVAKLSLYPSVLPLKLVASGRQYRKPAIKTESGLFSAIQSNVVQTFVATQTESEADAQMDEILNLAVDLYKSLDVDFRVVYKPAKELAASESLVAAFEIFSPSIKQFVEVGRISHFSDFVSKRLLFNTREKKDYKFLNVVGGTVAHSSHILAALIENGVDLNNILKKMQKTSKIEEFKTLFE